MRKLGMPEYTIKEQKIANHTIELEKEENDMKIIHSNWSFILPVDIDFSIFKSIV